LCRQGAAWQADPGRPGIVVSGTADGSSAALLYPIVEGFT
jgi:hypothetical protein